MLGWHPLGGHPMKMLLAVLQLTLLPQETAPGEEKPVSRPGL